MTGKVRYIDLRIRLAKRYVDWMDKAISRYGFKDRSEFIRDAVREFIRMLKE